MLAVRAYHAVLLGCAAALLVSVTVAAQEHAGHYSTADIEYGLGLYRTRCANCHGEDGATMPGIDLRRATPRAESDEALRELLRVGIPGTAMPPGEHSDAELTALVAYVRTMGDLDPGAVRAGNPERGAALAAGKGGCTNCHRIGQEGAAGSAPALGLIGTTRTAGRLAATLRDPTGTMIPINRPVRAVLADGTVVSGRRLNEDTYTVQLIDDTGRLRSLDKTALQSFTVLETSPMPSYTDQLTDQEIADVVAYLLTLRGPEERSP